MQSATQSPFFLLQPESSTVSPLLSTEALIGIAVGGVCVIVVVLVCVCCCWYWCFHVSHYDYNTGAADYKITAHYWPEGAAQYGVKRQDSLSSKSGISSRMSSIRSSLGMRSKVKDDGEGETYENQTATQYSTPV